jgi:hypothetical protein
MKLNCPERWEIIAVLVNLGCMRMEDGAEEGMGIRERRLRMSQRLTRGSRVKPEGLGLVDGRKGVGGVPVCPAAGEESVVLGVDVFYPASMRFLD